ncbi:MAG: phosphotransferase, partial [Sphingomonadaceae bacterium]|nr:phosphotransferase [Sphingomonadaceae bacterium]
MTLLAETNFPDGLDDFLTKAGWPDSTILPIIGDASFRRYFRIQSPSGQNAILMDAPPPHEDPRPFINVAQYLTREGFRAPSIFAADPSRGLVLIEDFGDERMREHLDRYPGDEERIYRQAIDTIVRLAGVKPAMLPPYDEAAYLREVRLLTEWYMPAMQLPVDQAKFETAWKEALAPVLDVQIVTVLRDYHAENIMLLDDGDQGLIDFQDALVGHPAYDLVSLLQDARRDVSPGLEAALLDYYADIAKPGADFRMHYALLGAQRNTKIIGIFTRLWKRDGKERYLGFLPRMWRLLERDLSHPGLGLLKQWFDTHI